MTAQTHVTLRVELDSPGDSISGRVLDEDCAGGSLGWVGQAAAIEAGLEPIRVVEAISSEQEERWKRSGCGGSILASRHAKGGLR